MSDHERFFYDNNNTFLLKVFVMINSAQAFVSTHFPIIVILAIEVSKGKIIFQIILIQHFRSGPS